MDRRQRTEKRMKTYSGKESPIIVEVGLTGQRFAADVGAQLCWYGDIWFGAKLAGRCFRGEGLIVSSWSKRTWCAVPDLDSLEGADCAASSSLSQRSSAPLRTSRVAVL